MRALLAVLLFSSLAWGNEKLSFQAPPGWIDATAKMTLEDFVPSGAPPNASLGMVASEPHGNAVYYAIVSPVQGPLTDQLRAQFASQVLASANRQPKADAKLRAQSLITIAGVEGARATVEFSRNGKRLVARVYYVPGDGEVATLTYECEADRFEQLRAIFEASAQATHGAVEPVPLVAAVRAGRLDWRAILPGMLLFLLGVGWWSATRPARSTPSRSS
jgi:hypothetical protein